MATFELTLGQHKFSDYILELKKFEKAGGSLYGLLASFDKGSGCLFQIQGLEKEVGRSLQEGLTSMTATGFSGGGKENVGRGLILLMFLSFVAAVRAGVAMDLWEDYQLHNPVPVYPKGTDFFGIIKFSPRKDLVDFFNDKSAERSTMRTNAIRERAAEAERDSNRNYERQTMTLQNSVPLAQADALKSLGLSGQATAAATKMGYEVLSESMGDTRFARAQHDAVSAEYFSFTKLVVTIGTGLAGIGFLYYSYVKNRETGDLRLQIQQLQQLQQPANPMITNGGRRTKRRRSKRSRR